MYDELVKRLKNCATQAAPCLTCGMTDDCSCIETLMKQAADAIEELRQQVEHFVPVPPHGRLIDADAFLALVNDSTILSDFLKCIISPLIRGEPTVIEAEEVNK